MDTIELECPSCKEVLEIDSGFAGGVCRCFSCGTMMTVPADPRRGHAERLERPDRPDAPGSAPASATEPVAESDAASSSAQAAAEQTLTTASGRKVSVGAAAVPTARKRRKALRAGILIMFIGGAIGLVALCYFAIQFVSGTGTVSKSDAANITRGVLGGYDPDVNPFLLAKLNVLGLPVGDQSVVVVDASAASRLWLSLAKEAVKVAAKGVPKNQAVQFVFWSEADTKAIPETLRPMTADDLAKAADKIEEVVPVGQISLVAAINKGLSVSPKHIVLITGQTITADQLAAIKAELDKHPGILIDTILIGPDSWDLQEYIHARKGSYVNLPMQKLGEWYREAESKLSGS